jgi:hypothetical protein
MTVDPMTVSQRTSATSGVPRRTLRQPRESGQATTEYALVLLGAAAVALLLVGWANRSGGGIGGLLDSVVRSIATSVR